jgi:hypothetical protein
VRHGRAYKDIFQIVREHLTVLADSDDSSSAP